MKIAQRNVLLSQWRFGLVSCCAMLVAAPARADDPLDSIMLHSPELPKPRIVRTYYDKLPGLLLEALDRPEADMRCQAAQEIAWLHQRGMPGLDRTVPALTRELERTGQHPSVPLAAARTLVALDARESAPALLKLAASGDADICEVVEPTLARWGYGPAREEWLKRLALPTAKTRATVFAMRGLATTGELRAVPRLRELVLSTEVAPTVRLEAARALGTLRTAGGEDDADSLAADKSPRGTVARLAGVWILRRHGGEKAVQRLQAFVRDPEPSVAAVAVARLVEIDPAHVEPVLTIVLASPDANVRGFGVEVLFRRPSEKHVRLLGDRLSDPHPDVRIRAREALRELANSDLRAPAIREGESALGATDWRGREQGAILLGQLDFKPAAGAMVDRLNDTRPEPAVAAAWALRKLAVPETFPKALAHFQRHTRTPEIPEWRDRQLSQLAQLLGHVRYRPADEAFRAIVPPNTIVGHFQARAAACWALGLLHEGKGPPQLTRALAGRLAAVKPGDVEDETVRWMCAISLGRMKAQTELSTLRTFFEKRVSLNTVSNACGWAIEQVAGEKMPPAGVIEAPQLGFFLSPLP